VEEARAAAANLHLSVKSEVEPELPALKMDRERILHVLSNFLSNAIKYSPPGGEVILRARKQGQGVYFSVADRGPGVPLQFQSLVFEKFFRVPGTAEKGAGLGLSIAREFVRAHRGRIGVQSEPGRGSEFYFTLPCEPNGTPAPVA
jgi:signal transduction histidine kinase